MSSFGNFGAFTTTPGDREGPSAPFSSPAMQANLFFRVFLGLVSLPIIWVPMQMLRRNSEFAGAVFCAVTMATNCLYVVNALAWPTDDVRAWPAGYGWCDLQTYVFFALDTSYNLSLFEIMRDLAGKVALLRATGLSAAERRRKRLVSTAVIFTFPFLQVISTYFVLARRYNVSTLVGCTPVYDANVLFLVFFVLPTPFFVLGAGVLAALVYKRFRSLEKATREVTHGSDHQALGVRRQRVRRKLYFLSLSVLVVVLPIEVFLFICNILAGIPWTQVVDLKATHFGPDPNNISFVSFTTSDMLGFADVNMNYIAALTTVPIFLSFGTTPDALNEYRKMLVALGLAKLFPCLKEEHQPRVRDPGRPSWWNSVFSTLRTKTTSQGSRKSITHRFSSAQSSPTSPNFKRAAFETGAGGLDFTTVSDHIASSSSATPSPEDSNPWPDLAASTPEKIPSSAAVTFHDHQHAALPHRNPPWVFRTVLASPLRLPPLPHFSFGKSSKRGSDLEKQKQPQQHPKQQAPSAPTGPSGSVSQPHHWASPITGPGSSRSVLSSRRSRSSSRSRRGGQRRGRDAHASGDVDDFGSDWETSSVGPAVPSMDLLPTKPAPAQVSRTGRSTQAQISTRVWSDSEEDVGSSSRKNPRSKTGGDESPLPRGVSPARIEVGAYHGQKHSASSPSGAVMVETEMRSFAEVRDPATTSH